MKRPQGFDGPPPARRTPVASAAPTSSDAPPAPSRASAIPSSPVLPVAPRRGAANPSDATDTEPIVVVGEATARVVVGDLPPNATDAVGAAGAAGAAGATPGASELPGDARAARRAIASAERERRKYERSEVRRFTQRSRRRRMTWLIAAATVVLVAGGAVGAAYSPLMALREVRIEGAQRIPVDRLQAAFAGELGTPLPLVTSADVREALSAFPLIETYSTETVPPSTLVVRIVERTPVGVIQADDGLELVDAAGVVIDRPAERPEGEPLIEAGPVASEGFRAAAAVVRSLPPEVRTQLVQVSAETADDVRLELAGGASVVWGSAEQSQKKADVLTKLMAYSPPDTVGFYDVSSPDSVVTG